MTSKIKEKIVKLGSESVAIKELGPIKSDPVENVNIVLEGKAAKLNPKSGGFISYEVKLEDNELHLRITKNDGGGLHSKEWLAVKDILSILDTNKLKNEIFNSTVLKPLFKSGSANNVSFLASILRSENLALIAAVPSKMYSHQMNDKYDESKQRLLALASKS